MTTPKPNAELAYLTLDHIDAQPEQWQQRRWIGKAECGTVGCFAGWAVMLSGAKPRDFGPDGYTTEVEFEGDEWAVSQLAQRLLRADRWLNEGCDDERDLFDTDNTREDLGRLVEEIFGPRPRSCCASTEDVGHDFTCPTMLGAVVVALDDDDLPPNAGSATC